MTDLSYKDNTTNDEQWCEVRNRRSPESSLPMKAVRKPLFFFVFIFLIMGCSWFAQPVAPAVRPPSPSPTPEICSENPPGLSIEIVFGRKNTDQPVVFQSVVLSGNGFNPGEKLQIHIDGHGDTHGAKIDTTDYPVKADGTFSISDGLPLDDPSMFWEVHVVHQRGIACLGFQTQR